MGIRTWLGAGLLAMAALAAQGSPAAADCVHGLAYVERENAPTIWVLGPDPCVYPTAWNHVGYVGPVDVGHDMPDGAPNRVFVEVLVPVP